MDLLSDQKLEKAREAIFKKKLAPLMDKLTELCDKHSMPMLIAVQLFSNETTGARLAAQAVQTNEMSVSLAVSSAILRGQAKVSIQSDRTFLVTIAESSNEYETLGVEPEYESEDKIDASLFIRPTKYELH